MKYQIHACSILFCLTMLLGCNGQLDEDGKRQFWSPPSFQLGELPQGRDPFSTGFRDGCNDFVGATGTGADGLYGQHFIYQTMQLDPVKGLIEKAYANGYRRGAKFCSTFVNSGTTL